MTLPTLTDIDALLAFMPGFRERERRFVRTEPSAANSWSYRYDPDVYAFFGVASAECWMDHDYDPERATMLLKDPRAIAGADLLTLRTLMTACVRGEKFCDGWWASILQDGTLLAVLERLEAIRGSTFLVREPETVESLFAQWRSCAGRSKDWGLAWYLSYEICRRYYRSHGIAPFVINFGGPVSYYGIELTQLPCEPTGLKDHKTLGRLTMAGNVENWFSGSPGDHGCDLVESCSGGAPAHDLVAQAIRHLGLAALPPKPHNHCRHKRRGDSFVLLWELATLLALRADMDRSAVCLLANGLEDDKPHPELDALPMTYRQPGHFWFGEPWGRGVYVTDEGVLCDGSGENLWERYMAGESPAALAEWLRERIAGCEG